MATLNHSRKSLVALAGTCLLASGTGQASPFCLVESASKHGDSVDVRFTPSRPLWIETRPGEQYRWEAGQLTRMPLSDETTRQSAQPALRLELGQSATYDFGSHHSGCTLTVVSDNGKLLVRMHSWTYMPGRPAEHARNTLTATE
jgi:hypothetical protein